MAIVRIELTDYHSSEIGPMIGRQVITTMQQVLSVPPAENYIICQNHSISNVLYCPEVCTQERLQEIVFIQVCLNQGRSPDLKKQFMEDLIHNITDTTNLHSENIFINLVEVARENWMFGISV